MNFNILPLILVAGMCLSAQAACPKNKKEDIAKEVVTAELLGASLSSPFTCLNDHAFKYIKPHWFAPNEGNRLFSVGVELDSLKINKIETVDEFSGQYLVHFEVQAVKKFGGEVHKDKMEVALFPNSEGEKKYGCGHSMSSPSKDYLAKRCYTPGSGAEE